MSSGRREGIPCSIGYERDARWAGKVRRDGHRQEREALIEGEITLAGRPRRKKQHDRSGEWYYLLVQVPDPVGSPYYGIPQTYRNQKMFGRFRHLSQVAEVLATLPVGTKVTVVKPPKGERFRTWRLYRWPNKAWSTPDGWGLRADATASSTIYVKGVPVKVQEEEPDAP